MSVRIRGRLYGGPMHGKRITVEPRHDRIMVPHLPRLPAIKTEPRPPWWRPLARRRWKPLPPPVPVTYRNLLYRYLATDDDGQRIYAYDEYGGRSPATEPLAKDLYRYLVDHLYSKNPAERYRMHWVMDSEWARECETMCGPGSDNALRMAHPTMFGVPVEIRDDGGMPHLEPEDGPPRQREMA
jgi:hypothetical protein